MNQFIPLQTQGSGTFFQLSRVNTVIFADAIPATVCPVSRLIPPWKIYCLPSCPKEHLKKHLSGPMRCPWYYLVPLGSIDLSFFVAMFLGNMVYSMKEEYFVLHKTKNECYGIVYQCRVARKNSDEAYFHWTYY